MNVLDLFAKLSLDSSEYDKGLEGAKSKASSIGGAIGKGLATVGKVAGVAIGAATTAVGVFAKSSIDAGMDFDKAMSQVQATMLKTDEEMSSAVGHSSTAFGEFQGNLREFAQFLGQNTAFSATEAAEALNYMALAGYDVQQSMDMLPNVLSLAAAGNFDLARASDMVTDAQTAFGINAERTTQMVDEMAKAASTGNTSVEQLGDAFLVVGGLAKELNGGMVTLANGVQEPVDGLQEMEIALTAMANAGVKGSEAGTHMRNMLLKLSSPTKDGTAALEEMGVTVFDTEGKMRSLSDIFGDLSNELDNMTQEQKIQTISDLFNTRDMASAEALLAAVGQDWDKIGESILNAQYSLKDVNNAVKDSGVEWTKYADTAWGSQKNAIEELTSQIRYNLDNQGMSVAETAKFIADEYDMSFSDATKAVEAAKEAMDSAKGSAAEMADIQLDNLAGDITLFKSALEGAKIAVSDVLTAEGDAESGLRKFVRFGTDGLSRLTSAFKEGGLSGAMDEFSNILSEGIAMITKMLPSAINAGMQLLGAVGQGIIQNLPVIIDAATQIIPMLGKGIIQALPALLDGAIQIVSQLGTFLIESIPMMIPAIIQLVTQLGVMLAQNVPALVNGVIALVTGIAVELINNLPLLLDATIQITIALAQAIIENLPVFVDACVQILAAIVNLIVEYGGQFLTAVGNALKNIWDRAVAFGKEVVDFIVNSFKNFVDNTNSGMRDMFNKVVEWLAQLPGKMAYYAGYAIGSFIKFVMELPSKVQEILTNTMNKVIAFGTNFVNKAKEMAKNFLDNMVNGIKNLPSSLANIFNSVISTVSAFASNLISKASEAASGFVSRLVDGVSSLPGRFAEIGSNIVQGIWNGISSGWDWLRDSVADLANSLLQGAKDALGIASPSKEFAWIGRMVDEGFAKGIIDYAHLVDGALDDIINIPDINAMVGDLTLSANADKSNTGFTQVNNIYSPTALSPYEVARQTRNATRDMVLAMNMGG